MFVRTLDQLRAAGQEKVLAGGDVHAIRLVTAADGMGFSMSDVRVAAGAVQHLWYKHHWEANLIVAGEGRLVEAATGEHHALAPGVLYCVGPKDRHTLEMGTEVRLLAIFNPPLSGEERHDADGAYPPTGELPAGPDRMFVRSLDGLRAAGRERVVAGGSARSVRALLAADGLGFTVCDVRLAAGNRNKLWYKHHREANYVLAGSGDVEDLGTGERWPLAPGVLYCVGPDDRHAMHAADDLHLVSVFCPALEGDEMHDADGALPPTGPVPPGPAAG